MKWEYTKEEGEKANLSQHRYNPVVVVLKVVSRVSHLVGKDWEFFFIFMFSKNKQKNLFIVFTK